MESPWSLSAQQRKTRRKTLGKARRKTAVCPPFRVALRGSGGSSSYCPLQGSYVAVNGGVKTGHAAAQNQASGGALKTLNGLTPYEYICKIWTSEPDRFILNPIHQMPGLNSGATRASLRR